MSPDPDDAAPSRRERPHDDGPPDGARDGTRPDAAVAELERHRTELRELGLETSPAPRDALVDPTRPLVSRRGWQDNTFRVATHSGGTLVLLIMTMVGLFLLYRGAQAIDVAGWDFVTEQAWEPNSGRFGIAAVLFGTVVIGLTAIGVAVPLALMTATYITEYAPAGIKRLTLAEWSGGSGDTCARTGLISSSAIARCSTHWLRWPEWLS
jgi:phosphate transport system permease protein